MMKRKFPITVTEILADIDQRFDKIEKEILKD